MGGMPGSGRIGFLGCFNTLEKMLMRSEGGVDDLIKLQSGAKRNGAILIFVFFF